MASETLKNLIFSFTYRPAPKRGPTSSDNWNDSFNELSNDLRVISSEWNNKLTVVTDALPNGSLDTQIDAFSNGLDGKNLWVDQSVSSADNDLTFYNSSRGRPNTVKEQFDAVYSYIGTQLESLEESIVDQATGLTNEQKNRIGANVFDSGQSSLSTSLDGKSENNRLNLIQLASDMYGATAVLNNNGTGILTNANLYQMLSSLLSIHNSAWNTGTSPTHVGAFTATQADINTSAPGNDSFVGAPTDLEEDLDQIRTVINSLKGAATWLTSLSSLYGGGANSLEDLLTSTQGSASKSASNPWGYRYDDIDGLVTRLNAVRDFVGQDSITDTTPDYSSSELIGANDSLEKAVSTLDDYCAQFSGQFSAISTFIGKDTLLDSTPLFTSGIFVSDGDSLETAVDKLDLNLATFSGTNQDVTDQLAALTTFVGQDSIIESAPGYSSYDIIDNGDSLETAIGKLDASLSLNKPTIDEVIHSGSFYASAGYLHQIDPSATMNVIMPSPSGLGGVPVIVKVKTSSSSDFNIVSSGLHTVDGQSSQSVSGGNRISITLISDNHADWMVV